MLPATLVNKVSNLWLGLNLRAKLSVCLVGMTVIPLLLTTLITGYNGEKALARLVIDHNWNAALHTADDVDRVFYSKMNMLHLAAATAEIKSMIPAKQLPLLKQMTEQDEDIVIIVVADTDGNLVTRSDARMSEPRTNYSDRNYFQTMKATGQTVISESIISKITGVPGIVIAEPIRGNQQEIVGAMLITVELNALIEHINQTKIGQTGNIFLVNQYGQIIMHSDETVIVENPDVSGWVPVKAVLEKQTGWIAYEVNGEKKLAAYSYIPNAGWGLVAEQPLKEALEYVTHVKRTGFTMSVVGALLASMIGIMVAGKMAKRITNIEAVTGQLAAGNLDASIRITAEDEIGRLGRAFNSMAAQLKASSAELRDSEERYRSLVENTNVGVYRKSGEGNSCIEYANPALARMLGYSSVEDLLKTCAEVHFFDAEGFAQLAKAVEQQGTVKDQEIVLRKKDGTCLWGSVTAAKHFDEKRDLYWIDSIVEDITERKMAEESLRQAHAELERKVQERTQELQLLNETLYQISVQDGLTEIANRRYFDEFLGREWQRAKREQQPVALIMLDVDWFKRYNDTYGHVAGDQCLQKIAEVLQSMAKRPADLAARYGGEEFALILPNTNAAGAEELGNQILEAVRKLGIINETSAAGAVVTVSLGIATCIPSENEGPHKLIRTADQALYHAKEAGRNQLAIADSGMDDKAL
ncbi:MAG: diguanylate cyclase with and Cache sensor [Firmicutes bacterium]|nr:diguanylate cyclase with and Cache sensor [Bacillota bacterium]